MTTTEIMTKTPAVGDPLEGIRTEETAIVVKESQDISLDDLSALGFIAPVAMPEVLRAAFDNRQKMITAILDPRDFMYTVPYTEQGKTKQQICNTLAEAEKWAGTYKTEFKANPKKSGVVKIAVALGIRAERKETQGLPNDSKADYAYCVYVATHIKTGASAEGVGWCDKAERGGRSLHDIIAMADTRAFCRAVLRLAGLGDVGADEILASNDIGLGLGPVTIVESPPPQKSRPQPLPKLVDVDVLTAARAWASEIIQRAPATRYADAAAQERGNWPQVRAKARRGDSQSALHLGRSGLRWEGLASDGPEYETFIVEESPVSPEDLERAEVAASEQAPPATPPPAKAPESKPQAAAAPASTNGTHKQPTEEEREVLITDAQKVKLSNLMVEKLGTKAAAIAWLKETYGIESSTKMLSANYEAALRKLAAITK